MHAATHLSHFCFTPCFPFKNPWRNFPGFSGPLNRCGPAMCWGSPKLCFIGKIGRAGYCFKLAFIGIPKVAVGFGTDPIWTDLKLCFIFQPHPDRHGVNSSPQHVAGEVSGNYCYFSCNTRLLLRKSRFDFLIWLVFVSTISPSLSTFWWGWVKEKPKKNSPWRAFRQMQACKQ